MFPLSNDFDPDGDGFGVGVGARPRRTAGSSVGSATSSTTSPMPGSPAPRSITYRIRDGHGLLATGRVTVWVDTAVRRRRDPFTAIDHLVVYQGSSVWFTVADLLVNDDDQQGQALSVVAVSQPGRSGCWRGRWSEGFTFTPSDGAAVRGSAIVDLVYLVVDPDGHVAQQTVRIRVLAADDTNQAPVAVPDTVVARTARGAGVPVGQRLRPRRATGSRSCRCSTPAHGRIIGGRRRLLRLRPRRRVRRHRDDHLPDPRRPRPAWPGHRRRPGRTPRATSPRSPSRRTTPSRPARHAHDHAQRRRPRGRAARRGRLVTPPAGTLTGELTGAAPTLTYTAPTDRRTDVFVFEVSDGTLTAQAHDPHHDPAAERRAGRRRRRRRRPRRRRPVDDRRARQRHRRRRRRCHVVAIRRTAQRHGRRAPRPRARTRRTRVLRAPTRSRTRSTTASAAPTPPR